MKRICVQSLSDIHACGLPLLLIKTSGPVWQCLLISYYLMLCACLKYFTLSKFTIKAVTPPSCTLNVCTLIQMGPLTSVIIIKVSTFQGVLFDVVIVG